MKTVIGLFDAYAQAQDTVTALKMTGIASDDISVITSQAEAERLDQAKCAEAGDMPAFNSMFNSAKGLLNGLIGANVVEDHAHVYAESVKRGGVLLAVRIHDDREGEVNRVMARHDAIDADDRRRLYLDEGWRGVEAAFPLDAAPAIRPDRSSYRAQVARP
jgi:hypothetical protein